MRSLSHRSVVLSMLALSGCVLDQYSFNGRDGAPSNDARLSDGSSLDSSSDVATLPDVISSTDVVQRDVMDGATSMPDAAADGGCVEGERPSNGIFVSTAGASVGDGSESQPVTTLAQALMLAQSNNIGTIYLDRGAHTAPASISGITIPLRIVGGWSFAAMRWSRDCASTRNETTIQSSSNVGLVIDDNAGAITLERLTVRPKMVASPSESLFAMIVRGRSRVTLDDVALVAPDAGDASPTMSPAAVGNRACDGINDCVGADRQPGAMGMSAMVAGRDAMAGVFSAMGYTPGDGVAGQPGGSAGGNGGPGLAGAVLSNCTDCNRPAAPACHTCISNQTVQGDRGRCGCGGLPGNPGAGGRGGGSSVALLIGANASVVARGSALSAGRGGNGAAGSTGGAGGAGTAGTDGMTRTCPTVCTITACMSCVRTSDMPASGGGKGGDGGRGGSGSAGGAGAGGNSHAVVTLDSATFDRRDSTLRVGIAGASGGGSAPMGTATLTRP